MATLSSQDTVRIPSSAEEIRDQILTDVRLEARNVGITDPEASVAPGTDNHIWGTAQANAGMLQYAAIGDIRTAITPLNAIGADLERWRLALKLPVVQPTGANGKLTVTVNGGGSVTVSQGQQFILPNGLRGQASFTHTSVTDGSDVAVGMIDTGSATNTIAGTKVRWVNPPFNLATDARVSLNQPLTGGFDQETDSRKRERVLNRLGNSPGGGNFGQLRELAFNANAALQNAFVYPALGGPSSVKLVLTKAFDRDRNDFSRALDSTAATFIRAKVQETVSEGNDLVVNVAADQAADFALAVTLPASSLAGGAGTGWLDAVPWPAPASPTKVTVTAVADSRHITIDAVTAIAPTAGVTRIAWWSKNDMRFRVGLITAYDPASVSGSWILTLQDPLVDSTNTTIAVGDFISPAAERLDDYAATLLDEFEALGPGENTADANRLPRAQRNPTVAEGGPPSDLTEAFKARFIREHAEISNAVISYAPTTTPTVPASVDDPPNVLVPRHFGVYVQS
jgi:uncharacterized phage protein gp47/JayE